MGFRNPVSSNLYELNLDWILFQVKKFAKLIPQMQSAEDDIQTAIDTANTANSNASTAVSTANTAQSTANVALSTATNAQTTADGISSTATQALNTANTAQSTATQAQATAEGISDTASQALSTANTALTTAEGISDTASQALSTANTANSTATQAQNTANTANSNASTALSTANTAQSTADSALSTANTANSNASTALSTANTAQSTAEDAQDTADTALSTAEDAQDTAEEAKQIAEQAVSALPSDSTPSMDSTASAGISDLYSRGDHVHPSDTSKVSKTGDTMTGQLINTDANITVQNTTLTDGTKPNSSTNGQGFNFYDSLGALIGYCYPRFESDTAEKQAIRLASTRKIGNTSYYAIFDMGIDKNGNKYVDLNTGMPSAFRDALGLGGLQIFTASVSGGSSKTFNLPNNACGLLYCARASNTGFTLMAYRVGTAGNVYNNVFLTDSSVTITKSTNTITIANGASYNANIYFLDFTDNTIS